MSLLYTYFFYKYFLLFLLLVTEPVINREQKVTLHSKEQMSSKAQDWQISVCAASALQPLARGNFHGLNAGLGAVSTIAVQHSCRAQVHFTERLKGVCSMKNFIISLFTSPVYLLNLKM